MLAKIWVATQRGLNLYKPETKTFDWFDEQKGLPATLVRAIADGEGGQLWLTTNKGIFLFNPATQSAVNYNSSADLAKGKNFYSNSLIKASGTTFLPAVSAVLSTLIMWRDRLTLLTPK